MSVAMGKYVVECMKQCGFELKLKADYLAHRKGIPCFREMSQEERKEIIKKNPLYGNIVCRCETVTEGEIVEAIQRPLGAKTMDAVKRRVRAGMGRCQGGFCGPKVIEILAREWNMLPEEVEKNLHGSYMLTGTVK